MPNRLTIVGLGPGTWESLTQEAVTALHAAGTVYVRTAVHPSLSAIREHLREVTFQSFDRLYETESSFATIYEAIVSELTRLLETGDVTYAVPGSPSLGETTVRMLVEQLEGAGNGIRLVQGVSFIEPVLAAAGVADAAWIEVIDASEAAMLGQANAFGEAPGESVPLAWRAPVTTAGIVISPLYSREIAGAVKLWLAHFYPDDHPITLVWSGGTAECRAEAIPLFELDRRTDIDHRTALYVPPLGENDNVRTFAGLMQLARRLRSPGGCPWDREQTHASLKTHLLEEAYEVLDALDQVDPALIAEELGDLLFQVAIHCQIADEAGDFAVEDVIQNIMQKLIGRHPHVFGDVNLESAQDVLNVWESFKQREKPERESVLAEIPKGLPALPQANLMQKRAASVGFEWPEVGAVMDKVEEELRELREEVPLDSQERQREELGDILFALVSVARHLGIDPEEALRLANGKFATRFRKVEVATATKGTSLRKLTPEQLDEQWEKAKRGS